MHRERVVHEQRLAERKRLDVAVCHSKVPPDAAGAIASRQVVNGGSERILQRCRERLRHRATV
jgi:hypothetical protein